MCDLWKDREIENWNKIKCKLKSEWQNRQADSVRFDMLIKDTVDGHMIHNSKRYKTEWNKTKHKLTSKSNQ